MMEKKEVIQQREKCFVFKRGMCRQDDKSDCNFCTSFIDVNDYRVRDKVSTEQGVCEKCKGKKEVLIGDIQKSFMMKTCPRCKGTGKEPVKRENECGECKNNKSSKESYYENPMETTTVIKVKNCYAEKYNKKTDKSTCANFEPVKSDEGVEVPKEIIKLVDEMLSDDSKNTDMPYSDYVDMYAKKLYSQFRQPIAKEIVYQKCDAHFKGGDGQGTCDTGCQWYTGKGLCPNSVEYKEIERKGAREVVGVAYKLSEVDKNGMRLLDFNLLKSEVEQGTQGDN